MEILSEHTCQGWLEGYLLAAADRWLRSHDYINVIVAGKPMPFDMVVRNDVDRFHLAMDVIRDWHGPLQEGTSS